jgi:hypothetical protein
VQKVLHSFWKIGIPKLADKIIPPNEILIFFAIFEK